jgi:hypothetical protein
MFEKAFLILTYLYLATLFVAGIIAFVKRNVLPNGINILWTYFIALILVEITVDLSKWYFKIDMKYFLALYNVFGIIEYGFVAFLYYHSTAIRRRSWVVISFCIYTIFVLVNMIFLSDHFTHNYTFIIRCLLFIWLTLAYFWQLSQSHDIVKLTQIPLFWISVGIFVFSMGSIFVQGLGSDVTDKELAFAIYLLNPILNIYLYTMFIISFLCTQRNPGYSSSL